MLNDLEKEHVFQRYAIGGAMAATFYAEPLLTFDLDIFVLLQPSPAGLLSLSTIYEALRAHGYREDKECVSIEGVPVQFLPAYNRLTEEALAQAPEVDYEGVLTRVLRPEHLAAICVQTGRAKDRDRVRILREQAKLDLDFLAGVLKRHQLEEKWKLWME